MYNECCHKVRHPFERVVSAYQDKVIQDEYDWSLRKAPSSHEPIGACETDSYRAKTQMLDFLGKILLDL